MDFGLFHSSEKTRVTLIKWLNGIQTPSSLLFFLKIVKSRVSCEHGEAARRETRDSCLTSVPLHALRVGQRQHTLLLMRYKRFNGYLDYLSTFIYMVKICLELYELMSVLFGTKCI